MPIPRAIPRRPVVPPLSTQAISLLTHLCFRPPEVKPAELIFNFSTPRGVDQVVEIITHLVTNRLSSKLLSTGGAHNYSDDVHDQTPPLIESQLLIASLPQTTKDQLTIFQESVSQNFLQNVQEGLKVIDFSHYKTLIFITKAYASGRAYLTLRKFCPHTQLFAQTYSPVYQPGNIVFTHTDWWTSEVGQSLVWGEFLRINLYASRGQIALEPPYQDVVNTINLEVPQSTLT